jgi:hypothetical protein
MTEGSLGGHEIPPLLGRWGGADREKKVIRFLEIYDQDPELAKIIAEQEIAGFHGTRSASLWGILKHDAILSAAEASLRGQPAISGERMYSEEGGQKSISFADWRRPDTIGSYAGTRAAPLTIDDLLNRRDLRREAAIEAARQWGEKHPFAHNSRAVAEDLQKQIEAFRADPNSEEALLTLANFPIAFGVSTKDMELAAGAKAKGDSPRVLATVKSDIPGEFALMTSQLSLGYIPMVAVPAKYIDQVQAIFNKHNKKIAVIDLELIIHSSEDYY